MIFVRDKGRMCNNMLQYGHAYAWAREHDRSVLSMRFSYKYQYFKLCHQTKHNFLSYLIGKFSAKLGLIPTVGFYHPQDEGSAALEEKMLSHRHFLLEGWYIRFYDLFLKYRDEITDQFQFDDEIQATTSHYINATSSTGDILLGIHIRRGDYKKFKGGRFYYDDQVYIDYIRQFASLHPDKHISVYICSNDPHLDKTAFSSSLPSCTVSFPCGNPAEDLCVLSECHYLIGAPSTFSLVAAMYHDIPLLWMLSGDSAEVQDNNRWGQFEKLFREIL